MFNFFGKKAFQNFFKKLHRISLIGMNYSSARKYGDNGEKNVLKMFKKKFPLQDSLVIFDVGANLGVYSQYILKLFKDLSYELYSFEPSRSAYEQLSKSIGSRSNIHLENQGLSNQTGDLELFFDKQASPLASVYPRDLKHTLIDFDKKEIIQVITLDRFCQDRKIDVIHFLKLDVEGHELAVLEGSKDLLAQGAIHCIQFEFGGCNIDSRTYFKDLFGLLNKDFSIYRIVRDGLVPIETYDEKLEIFQSCNFLAVFRGLAVSFS